MTRSRPATGHPFLRVLQAEFFKAFRKRRLYVLAGLYWVLAPVLLLIVGAVVLRTIGGSFIEQEPGITGSQLVQQIASPYGIARALLAGGGNTAPIPFFLIVIGLLAALMLGEERSQNMWKTVLVAQPARLAVLWGKFAVVWLLFGGLLLGGLLASVAFGAVGTLFLDTRFGGDWGGLLELVALQWAFGAAAVAFAFLVFTVVRNSALALAVTFFLPNLLEWLYALYRITVGFQPVNRLNAVFQALRLRQTLEDLPRYFFTNNLYLPSRAPLTSLMQAVGAPAEAQAGVGSILGLGLTLPHAALVMAGYLVLFGGLVTWIFLRRDAP